MAGVKAFSMGGEDHFRRGRIVYQLDLRDQEGSKGSGLSLFLA